jgi:uncharacterized membrane protein
LDFGRSCNAWIGGIFLVIWFILRPFGIFCGRLV